MQKYIDTQLTAANKIFQRFDWQTSKKLVDECVKTNVSGKKIIASGLGKNSYICQKFISTLNSLGINSSFLHANTAFHGDLGIIKPGDLIIILTKSGETPETICLSKIIKKRKIKSWLVTCSKKSSTHKYFKRIITLSIDHEGDAWNLIPNNSVLVFLIFLQALTLELSKRLKISRSIFKKNHPGGGIGRIFDNKDILET